MESKGYLYDRGDGLLVRQEALPAVTSDDEGKVLTVNDEGEWEAANLPESTESTATAGTT